MDCKYRLNWGPKSFSAQILFQVISLIFMIRPVQMWKSMGTSSCYNSMRDCDVIVMHRWRFNVFCFRNQFSLDYFSGNLKQHHSNLKCKHKIIKNLPSSFIIQNRIIQGFFVPFFEKRITWKTTSISTLGTISLDNAAYTSLNSIKL